MKRCNSRMPGEGHSMAGMRCGLPEGHDDDHTLLVPTGIEYEPDGVAPEGAQEERERREEAVGIEGDDGHTLSDYICALSTLAAPESRHVARTIEAKALPLIDRLLALSGQREPSEHWQDWSDETRERIRRAINDLNPHGVNTRDIRPCPDCGNGTRPSTMRACRSCSYAIVRAVVESMLHVSREPSDDILANLATLTDEQMAALFGWDPKMIGPSTLADAMEESREHFTALYNYLRQA